MKDSKLIPLLPLEEYQRRRRRREADIPEVWDLLDAVKDPEIPVLSIWDLGVLQDIKKVGEELLVTITPTYSGCPAVDVMKEDILIALQKTGYVNSRVESKLSPAWTTAWMSSEGRKKLQEYGIAPSKNSNIGIQCPHCNSLDVAVISEFGSTSCKSLYRCKACSEAFDYFKNI